MSAASANQNDVRAAAAAARPDAFVSYAREDADIVEPLLKGLISRGKEVWVDREEIPFSAPWKERARAGIEAAGAVVFALSPWWTASEACRWELAEALATNKRLVPVRVSPEVGAEDLPPDLADLNWILADDGTVDDTVEVLVETLASDLEWRDEHARLLVRAIEWEQRGRDTSFLLRGSDLRAAQDWLTRQGEHEQHATPLQTEYIVASGRAATRRQRITLGAVLAALLVSLGLATFALYQRGQAIEREKVATSRELAASATGQLATDPELSLLLSVQAARTAATDQAAEVLRQALMRSHALATLLGHTLGSAWPLCERSVLADAAILSAAFTRCLRRVERERDRDEDGWDDQQLQEVPGGLRWLHLLIR